MTKKTKDGATPYEAALATIQRRDATVRELRHRATMLRATLSEVLFYVDLNPLLRFAFVLFAPAALAAAREVMAKEREEMSKTASRFLYGEADEVDIPATAAEEDE